MSAKRYADATAGLLAGTYGRSRDAVRRYLEAEREGWGQRVRAEVSRFLADLQPHGTAVADANVLIYHLEDLSPYSQLTRALLERLAEGSLRLVVSVLTAGEILAGPYRAGDEARVALATAFLQGLPNTTLAEVTLAIADRAVWLRSHGLRMPDAVVMATGLVHEAEVVLANDPVLQRPVPGGPRVLLLDAYCAPETTP